jgi:hypothetical protein
MISHARSTFYMHFHSPLRANQIADVPIVPKRHEQREKRKEKIFARSCRYFD